MGNSAGSICPQCNEPRLHRSREKGLWESIIKLLFQYKPYRCHGCGWRAMLRKSRSKSMGRLKAETYVAIAILTIVFAIVAAYWISTREEAPPPETSLTAPNGP